MTLLLLHSASCTLPGSCLCAKPAPMPPWQLCAQQLLLPGCLQPELVNQLIGWHWLQAPTLLTTC